MLRPIYSLLSRLSAVRLLWPGRIGGLFCIGLLGTCSPKPPTSAATAPTASAINTPRNGLPAVPSPEQLGIFEAEAVRQPGPQALADYLASDYTSNNFARERLNKLGSDFQLLNKIEALVKLNNQWLRRLPHLRVLPLAAEVKRWAAAYFAQ